MIPKVIHYCWFGGNPKPEIVEKCIASWRKFCPDWEIIEWNESNYDVEKIPFVKEAYKAKKWAFVSDFARLDVVYAAGGIYHDTDVELYAEPLGWLDCNATFFFETGRNINTGMGFSAEKGSRVLYLMMDEYKNEHFIANGKGRTIPCPEKNTTALCKFSNEFKRNGENQSVDGVRVMSLTDYGVAVKHHSIGLWVSNEKAVTSKTKFKTTWLKKILRRPENFTVIEKHFGKKAVSIYTFISYDLLEYGFLYYIKKIRKK